jgi:hypothetical protein
MKRACRQIIGTLLVLVVVIPLTILGAIGYLAEQACDWLIQQTDEWAGKP